VYDIPITIRGYVETPGYAKIPGYLKTIYVDKGDRVKKGQVITILESPETDKQVVDALANYKLQAITYRKRQFVSATVTLLDLAGDVGLLLWGTHMVTTGVLRGYGTDFRRWLGRSLSRRMNAFLVGLALTAVLQSSTATGLMATSFAASDVIDLASGLTVMLGANVGTTLIVQVLSFDIGIVAPILILAGVVLFRRATEGHIKNLGRIGIGLGLMLLALNLIVQTMTPFQQAPVLVSLMEALANQPILALLLAALLSWACHSSVAVMLFILSLVKSGVLASTPALALVLGANLGATVPALLEAGSTPAQRLPFGNLLVGAVGCIVALPILPIISTCLARIEPAPARIVVNFHTAFNLALAALFVLPVDSLAKWLMRLLPDHAPPADAGAPQYLDEAALRTASVALVNAARETLRMADLVQDMLKRALLVFRDDDKKLAAEISRTDPILKQDWGCGEALSSRAERRGIEQGGRL
jgi:phosphate:Na+ symporter